MRMVCWWRGVTLLNMETLIHIPKHKESTMQSRNPTLSTTKPLDSIQLGSFPTRPNAKNEKKRK
ncbi:Putative protein of unknown function [Podospora comata]|uniref:Uncharacterized protein n=1 Tax=Podospora comata TaxID=48703 RepID=A0ABY6RTW9_PODCO|nr:Putative protein of unknown function [Podospora comata]